VTAQIQLADAESEALAALAHRTGKSQDALLREAVSQFLGRACPGNFLQLVRRARGLWRDRDDLPDFARLRRECDRS
jgi:hypothetical protein